MKSKETKRREAIERQRIHNSLSPLEKIWSLDCRLGLNKGAKKERAKLENQLRNPQGYCI